ncbi:hypothetical protein AGMMS49944_23950 [Spirochaetia bacterium]|nr:hypothetical protein AGMMS49944_23950 [Spirochaetia bacterium]
MEADIEALAAETESPEAVSAVDAAPAETPVEAAAPEKKPNGFKNFMSTVGRGFVAFGKGTVKYLNNPEVSTRHNEPRRNVEFTLINAGMGFANNLITTKDIFQETIVIDLEEYISRIPEKGFMGLNADLDLSVLDFRFNSKKKGWGFGLSPVHINGGVDIRLPRSLLDMVANGNGGGSNVSDDFIISGSVFYSFDASSHFDIKVAGKPLRIGVDPSFYIPLLYIPKSTVRYTLNTEDSVHGELDGKFNVYTPIDISGTIDAGTIMSSGGVDFSLSAEYPLFTRLDVGTSIGHIPLVPASLGYGMESTLKGDIDIKNIGDGMKTYQNLDFSEFGELPKEYVFRPLRVDFYTLYRPLKSDIITIKPNIGFTVPMNGLDAFFNGALEVQFHIGKFMPGYLFNAYLSTGAEEGFWRHSIGMQLNLRAFELDIAAVAKSQDYLMSYQGSGMELSMAMKFGW